MKYNIDSVDTSARLLAQTLKEVYRDLLSHEDAISQRDADIKYDREQRDREQANAKKLVETLNYKDELIAGLEKQVADMKTNEVRMKHTIESNANVISQLQHNFNDQNKLISRLRRRMVTFGVNHRDIK